MKTPTVKREILPAKDYLYEFIADVINLNNGTVTLQRTVEIISALCWPPLMIQSWNNIEEFNIINEWMWAFLDDKQPVKHNFVEILKALINDEIITVDNNGLHKNKYKTEPDNLWIQYDAYIINRYYRPESRTKK